MNPALTQIIDHPEFGRIMLQAVAFAALGTNEKTVNALRKGGKLVEGEDFIRVPQKVGMARLHWTLNGINVLAIALGTDRALAFQADINRWLNERSSGVHADSAMQHQPKGDAVPPRMQAADAADEPTSLATWQPSAPLTATDYQEQPSAPGGYDLAELQAMRAIAQSERDGQMLALLDKAITALAAKQPLQPAPLAERVVYVQPQKTTHINFHWNWHGGSHNQGSGSMEAFFGLLLVIALLSGLWVIALVSAQRTEPVYPHSTGLNLHAE